MGNSGGRGFSIEKPLPRPPSRRDWGLGRLWGRGRFSERSASPPDPLSRRAAGVRRSCFCIVGSACKVGAASCCFVVVTAADRAAATCQRRAPRSWMSDRAKVSKGLPPQRALSAEGRLRILPSRRMSAAALSAAVDSPKSIRNTPNSQAEPSKPKRSNPNASRSSGGSAREGLLSEKPPPSHSPSVPPLREGARGRRFS